MNGARQLVDRREEIDGLARARAHVQMQLIDGLKVGDLEKECPAVRQHMGRADRQHVVAGLPRVPRRELGRAVARAIVIVPGLGEMTLRLLGDVALEWPRKCQQHTVFVGVEGDRELDRTSGVTHALKAAIGRGISAPAGHSRDIELAVRGIEPTPVRARQKVAGQRDGRSLWLAVDLLAQDQEMRARAIREMNQLALQGAESLVGDGHLGAARVIESSR